MAQIAKVSQEVELRSSAPKFYEFLKNKMDFVFQMFPEIYKSWKVVEGNGYAHGSVIQLKYNIDGLSEVKERLSIDDANKSLTFECVEGDLLRDFEVMKMKIEVVENGSNGSSANWSIEFVKANEDVATPHNYLLCVAKVSEGIDDYLCKN
ncbi:kirola-like isoform X1 [Cucurbita moschata]|uniref:Kirola-like isoform X1 n=2 Tax=Cucurbita moschata TaxID=3662 RepID=A0A6J1F4J9_CUCMO|nr:kirola-like isoform X1 [Cucurbita moschata]